MKSLGLSKQIIILTILPALLVGIMLSVYFTYDQLSFISKQQQKYANLVITHIQPVVEFAYSNNNWESLEPILTKITNNESVDYIRISNARNFNIITIDKRQKEKNGNTPFFQTLLEDQPYVSLKEPIYRSYKLPDGTPFREVIADIEIKLNTKNAAIEKLELIARASTLTLAILLLFSLFIFRLSKEIIAPIKSLTENVRGITAGDLNTHIELNSTGELGILESCINQMKDELQLSQGDLETQLDTYTDELQQTLEELEIRNAELDITRSKAIYANNAKSEFLANMSHEIRTPLSGVIGFTELLQSTNLSAQQNDYVHTIKKSAKSLLEIINDILDLSKIESGKTDITTSEFNLVDIIEDIITLLSPTALEKNIELFYRIESNVAIIVNADPFRLHQILTNLLGNAIKFTDAGYVYLQVTTGEIQNTEDSIKFTVSDTGIGMNGDDKNKLFKAFTQADTSITRRFGGTGLGLVISRKLTLLMKGEIGFDSTQGEGSTFWFSIPIIPIQKDYQASELTNKKIAFFSDNFIAKQSFKTLLENHQCKVTPYNSNSLSHLQDIENENDIIIVFLSRKEIVEHSIDHEITKLSFTKPSLLIASTQSLSELRSLQQQSFDTGVFTSEKIERIKQKLISIINKETLEDEDDFNENLDDTFDWSNINMMVVDDNEVNLRLAEIILHKHKARVTIARSGMQAIDYASMNSFDIIFMDLHMPGLDGYQTTKRIRETSPGKQPVIIALTANAMPSEKEKVIKSGMNGILIKPVSHAIFHKVIKQWVLKEPTTDLDSKSSNSKNNNAEAEVFSLDAAKEFTGNNEALAYELFDMLRAELDNYKKAISVAVNENNLEELLHQAHKLHGSSRCCGTTELKEASSRIENLINQKINFDLDKESICLLQAIQNVSDYEVESINK